MLIYSMSASVDDFISDREGAFGWTVPSDELFRFHLAQVRELGGYLLGRRLGGGTPFLPPVTDDIALDLVETRTFGSRVIYERYGRARDESEARHTSRRFGNGIR
jgi:hypothetical protein